ncbi:efflux RND transporter periplasmic adaptor subunit [Isoalcanivorax indicus]|uniref:efflux RND transporter periplasmic adaptor subunit n=1 Tax=Isoalcanivorax indicus TaxID=2202653 RepID=UPI000DB9B38E|nr:efflux RND transporter periplasmic adaptor subunit [Isoalcanivorax indicus]
MKKQAGIATLVLLCGGIGAYLLSPAGREEAPAGARPHTPVNVAEPRVGQVRDRVSAVATTAARDAIDITSEVDGRVLRLHFREGQRVEAGQPLVELDDRQARADLRAAEAQLRDARAKSDRATRLPSQSISRADVEELQAAREVAEARLLSARTVLDNHTIIAPFEGALGLRYISQGAFVRAGDRITTLDSISPIEVVFSVPERYLAELEAGQSVTALNDAFPGHEFNGTVTELGTRVDPISRSLQVKAALDNEEGRLRPGQFMSVVLTFRERDALLVPEEALMSQGSEQYVFVVVEDNEVERRSLRLGQRLVGEAEVLEGLAEGERVVITGQTRLSAGDRVNVLDDPDARVSVRASQQGHRQ